MRDEPEISLKMLQAFLTWAESGTEKQAANKLGITQPALHRKLERFQTQMLHGPRLMKRRTGGWDVTDEGKRILPVIRDLVRRFEQLETYLKDRESAPRLLRIATGQFAAQYILPSAIAALRRQLADCRAETYLARGIDRILGVADAQYDLAIVSHTPEQVHSIVRKNFHTRERQLTCKELIRYPFVVVACRDSPEGRALSNRSVEATMTPHDLIGLPLVGLDPQSGLRQRLERQSAGESLTFSTDACSGGWAAALANVGHGLGIALIPKPTLPLNHDSQFISRPFDASFTLDEYLVQRADFSDSTLVIAQSVLLDAANLASNVR